MLTGTKEKNRPGLFQFGWIGRASVRQGITSTIPQTKGNGLADEEEGKVVIIISGKGKSSCQVLGYERVWHPEHVKAGLVSNERVVPNKETALQSKGRSFYSKGSGGHWCVKDSELKS